MLSEQLPAIYGDLGNALVLGVMVGLFALVSKWSSNK